MVSKITSKQKKKGSLAIELLYQYCKDIEEWPGRWEIAEEDLIVGESIKDQFKLFLIDSIEKGRAKRTIKTYSSYLAALGGELISRVNQDESERSLLGDKLILKYVDESGGPYWCHARDESEHDQYDSVCRQLFKFMMANSQ